ncbi:hypothetical protein APHAL10511_008274 [Amanita phalloides]|nr:hypothetical protein APHAL10511_008274 [Amanita phalloides]
MRPSHFIALPLHTHPTLRTRVTTFQNALLNAASPIAGLDRSIVIDSRRLHMTLGVMALSDADGQSKTIDDGLTLLRSLQPAIAEVLQGRTSVKVRLNTLDALKQQQNYSNGSTDAHVLFLGPSDSRDDEGTRLHAVSNLVHQAFKTAGFITETRPLKLHCTILNTSYRRPRSRLPFSYSDILSSPAYESIHTDSGINFGVYDVQRVELWEMGSHGRNNEYRSCGGIDFLT